MKKSLLFFFLSLALGAIAQSNPDFRVIGFFTKRNDQAHISFVSEANRWLSSTAVKNKFAYDSTNNWDNLNPEFLSHYQVVLFLDARPDSASHRKTFQNYMEQGGAWMGFHFAGFALNHSLFPQNWDWYHNEFIGAGQYVSNTWRPVPAILRVEDSKHSILKNIPETFKSSASEWYRWEMDLRLNPDIKILLSVDPTSFPLGTGPKQHEIWHSGYYPIGWTNQKFRMVYFNMGHNDIDYENKTNRTLSYTFGNPIQNQVILNALLWLGQGKKK